MEDFRVDIVLGEGINARTVNIPLKKFTIIGATTRSGMLSGPLRDRFQMHEHLEFYENEELARIVTVNAAKLRTTPSSRLPPANSPAAAGGPHASRTRACDGSATTPRPAPTATSASTSPGPRSTCRRSTPRASTARTAATSTPSSASSRGGPTGVEALAATMNTAVDTLTDEVEPFLLRREFIVRTPRGRRATPLAYRILGLDQPEPTDSLFDQPRLFD